MKTLVSLLQRTSSWRGLAVLFFLYAIVFGTIVYTMSELAAVAAGSGILDFEFGYSKQKVMQVLASYGTEGMALYGRIQLLDLFNPALYSLFFASILHLLVRNTQWQWLVVLPMAAGTLDYAENVALYQMASSFPQLDDTVITIGSMLSVIKNLVLYSAIAAFTVAVIMWLRARLARG